MMLGSWGVLLRAYTGLKGLPSGVDAAVFLGIDNHPGRQLGIPGNIVAGIWLPRGLL